MGCRKGHWGKRGAIRIYVLDYQPIANQHLGMIELGYATDIVKLNLPMDLRARSDFRHYSVISFTTSDQLPR